MTEITALHFKKIQTYITPLDIAEREIEIFTSKHAIFKSYLKNHILWRTTIMQTFKKVLVILAVFLGLLIVLGTIGYTLMPEREKSMLFYNASRF